MAIENNIKTFTAADIEKYHKGLLSTKEMHSLEKAALDDPFLADALEGYAVPEVNVVADIADLQKRLVQKTEREKVVQLYATNKKTFPWLRVAAAVVIIGGAALLANQFVFNKPTNEDLAIVTEKDVATKQSATPTNSITDTGTKTSALTNKGITDKEKTAGGNNAVEDDNSNVFAPIVATPTRENELKQDATEATPRTIVVEEKANNFATLPTSAPRKDVAAKEEYKAEAMDEVVVSTADKAKAANAGITAPAAAKKMVVQNKSVANSFQTRVFRGRITDATNNGLPFAKVYNPADNNAGTYTDANGNFTLTYPDTILAVQIKALGYENAVARLQTNLTSNRVVMQDDRNISQVVISNQRVNANIRSANNMNNRQLVEPEPTDGWENYDVYIANNLETPEELRLTERKKGGSVQISFEVDKNGEPINISVDKSLCTSCDKEAIRLIKEGPKWRRNASKHGRTTVTINF